MVRRLPAALIPLVVIFLQPTGNAQATAFQNASVVAPAGASCVLRPQGDTAPEHSITIIVDADGVARFQAARATQPGAVAALALDCTGPDGKSQTIIVDLRSDSTFDSRPFDAVRAGLSVRPALTGDPESYTAGELIRQGYGLRPDPKTNPAGYARWLAGVRTPYYKLRGFNPLTRGSASLRLPHTRRLSHPSATITSTALLVPWTGAYLTGSYQKNATAALTQSYLANEATFNVPPITPGLYNTGTAWMSIWNGLDDLNLLQAIVWVTTTSTHASYNINRQDFTPKANTNAQVNGVTFTPLQNDSVYAQEWYCDSSGNPNLAGGYACTHMRDDTLNLVWDCSQANSSDCASFALAASALTNGNLGQSAEFVIENDTDEILPNVNNWPPFATVTMSGSALVVQGDGAGSTLSANSGTWVTALSDPSVDLAPDWTNSASFVSISLTGTDSVVWHNGPAECQAGLFAPGGNVSCSQCAAGTFSAAAGSAVCSVCSAGTYSAAGATACSSQCAAGTFTSGSAACSVCSAGTYSAAGATVCSVCSAGTYSAAGATACSSQCAAGTFTSRSAACSACSAGTYSAAGATACSLCPRGTYSAAGATACSVCPINTYSAAGAWSCTACPSGSISPSGAASCSPHKFPCTLPANEC
jgi:Tyrosine-protein kinase ephrin type A/B receptor-like